MMLNGVKKIVYDRNTYHYTGERWVDKNKKEVAPEIAAKLNEASPNTKLGDVKELESVASFVKGEWVSENGTKLEGDSLDKIIHGFRGLEEQESVVSDYKTKDVKIAEIEKDEIAHEYRKAVLDSEERTIILASLFKVRMDYGIEDKQTEVLTKIGRSYDEYLKAKKIEDNFTKEASTFLKSLLNKKQITITDTDVVYEGDKYFEGFESRAENKEAICADLSIEIVNKESFIANHKS